MRGLKTCLVTGQYPPQIGGVGHSAHRIARMLAEAGLEVHVAAFSKHGIALPFEESLTTREEEGVRVHRVQVFHPEPGAASEPETLTRYNREMFQALDHLERRFRFDVLHGFFLYPGAFIAGLVGSLHRVPTIASIRGNDVGKYAFDPLRLPFIRSALEHADHVTSVATSLIEMADRCLVPVGGRSSTILNSIDLATLRVRGSPELALHGTVIGSSGLFRYKKGLRYLFRALSELDGRFDFSLLLAGDFFQEEDREAHLEDLSRLGLLGRTVITGRIAPDRMADHLQLFDILVFPSLFSEGCPLSLLEAMAMGKPVVASRAGAIPEIVRHGRNGLLVEPGSSSEIARAIASLASDPDLRSRLGRAARATVAERTRERELAEWLRAYQAALDSRRSHHA